MEERHRQCDQGCQDHAAPRTERIGGTGDPCLTGGKELLRFCLHALRASQMQEHSAEVRKEDEDKEDDQADAHGEVALVRIYIDCPQSPLIAEGIAVPGGLFRDGRENGAPCGARNRLKFRSLMEDVPRTAEKDQYRCEEEGASSRGKEHGHRSEERERTAHAEDGRQVDRPDKRKTQCFEVTCQEIEHEVVLDVISGKVRILGREIGADAESGCDRHVRRKVAEDRVSETDGVVFHEAGIKIYEAGGGNDQNNGRDVEDQRARLTGKIRQFLRRARLLRIAVVSQETSLPQQAAGICEDTHSYDIGRQEVRRVRRNIGVHHISQEVRDPGGKEKSDQSSCRKQKQHRRYTIDIGSIRSDTHIQTADIRDQEADQLCAKEDGYDQI